MNNYGRKITEKFQEPAFFKKAIIVIFSACWIYWIYLIFASKMWIIADAIEYQRIGLRLHKYGWLYLFETGPHREPFYFAIIAASKHLSEIFHISHEIIQKFIQVIFLFASQAFLLLLLGKLRIRNVIKAAVILYFGFSPALVNAAVSSFSEIAVFPFVLAIVFFGALSWRAIYNSNIAKTISLALCTSLSFVFAVFAKGIFQYIYPFFLIPCVFILVYSIIRKRKAVFWRAISYMLIVFLVFNLFTVSYKLMNKKYNGHFEFTNRYTLLLFGEAVQRTDPLTVKGLLSHLTYIPGRGVCRLFFSEEDCEACGWLGGWHRQTSLLPGLLEGVPESKVKQKTLSLTFQRISKNPLQYGLFTTIEALRMPFWESTKVGFVQYPLWIAKIFSSKWFRYPLRLIISILTYISLVGLMIFLFRNRNEFFHPDKEERFMICLAIFLLIFSYTGLYSLFSIVIRYSLPIASLYLMCIGLFIDRKIYKDDF